VSGFYLALARAARWIAVRRPRGLNAAMDLPLPIAPSLAASGAVVTRPDRQTLPLVFVSPHSGRDYPADFIAAARLDPLTLRRSEDGFVDELFAAAPGFGAPLLAATFPRAFCDVNREAWELDPAMFEETLPAWVNTNSARVGAGLGTIARVVASGEAIYRRKLSFAEAERRVCRLWQPFHAVLSGLINATVLRFGACLLIDCHSMPANSLHPRASADFVLGDGYGTTCRAAVTDQAEQTLTALGYRVRRNDPYAGGYITRHYGRPHEGVHALQIEICRTLYMSETRIERLACFGQVQGHVTALIGSLARAEPGSSLG
jgi:N-formylglutamate deformylase